MGQVARVKGLLLAGLLTAGVATRGASGAAIGVELVFVPAAGDVNRLTVTVTASTVQGSRSDTEVATIWGTARARLTTALNHATHEARVSGLTFTGGELHASDMDFTLDYGVLVGTVEAASRDVGGSLRTPSPPGNVTGVTFPGAEHEAVLNHGTFEAHGTRFLAGLFDPVTIDLAAEPIAAPGTGTGSLTVSDPQLSGRTATYDVTLSMPLNLSETVLDEGGVKAVVTGNGLLRAARSFSRTVPVLGDVNGDEEVDAADIDCLHASLGRGDPNCDMDGNWTVNRADADRLVREVLASDYGDADLDRDVDVADYLVVKRGFASGLSGWSDGDFNGDRVVGYGDYVALRDHFGRAAPPGGAVPEPGAISLLVAGAVFVLRLRTRPGRNSSSMVRRRHRS